MPELRQNFVTKEWVIISTERAKRPSSYAEPNAPSLSSDHPTYVATCPFCPGNEEIDLEVSRIPNEGPWQVRIVGNRFPALSGQGQPIHTVDGVQHRLAGVGLHDVIVTHPRHNTTLSLMQPEEVQLVFEIMQQRGQTMARDPRIQQVIYFQTYLHPLILAKTLIGIGGDPDGDVVTYTIAFGSNNPPSVVRTTTLTSYTPLLISETTYYGASLP
ncbi:MAG: hypothetical protein HC828_19175, partial [Blastochloris sp.]|nr:hypothetical protein [Blastochloris sp.]